MISSTNLSLLVMLPTLLWSVALFADSVAPVKNPLTVSSARWIKDGATDQLTLEVQWNLAKDHHAYLDQFRIQMVVPSGLAVSIQDISPVVEFEDKFSKKIRRGVKGSGQIYAVVALPKTEMEFPRDSEWILTYQACTDEFCHLPKQVIFKVPWIIHAGVIEGAPQDWLSASSAEQFIKALFLIFLAGIATSFTPCIFPMIPITLAVLGARETHSKRAGLILSFSYVLGIAGTYSLLGIAAALSGALFGSLLSHPMVVGLLALLFIAFGASLLGVFEIRLPLVLAQKLHTHKSKRGWIGAFMAGNIAGLVASPCVGPVLAGILAFVVKTQDVRLGFIYLFVFAFGMGQLFLLLGTFSGISKFIPKSGVWMEAIKYLLGLTMHILAFYFLGPVLSKNLILALIGFWFIALSFYFGAKRDEITRQAFSRLMVLVLFVFGILVMALATSERIQKWSGLRMTSSSLDTERAIARLPWTAYSKEALNSARIATTPVVIDFYADWCVACKELEIDTFSNPEIQQFRDQIVWLKFDATQDSREFSELRKHYNIVGLPHLVFIDAQGTWREALTLNGFEDVAGFKKRLQTLLSRASSR